MRLFLGEIRKPCQVIMVSRDGMLGITFFNCQVVQKVIYCFYHLSPRDR